MVVSVLNFIRFLSYNFAQFVYLDLSPTSLAIAKARAELAGCTNVRWFQVGHLVQRLRIRLTKDRGLHEVEVEKELEVNVDCAQERLERLPQLDLGQFDYIECSGVRSDENCVEEIHLNLI